jgi:uncharacterized membrane protein
MEKPTNDAAPPKRADSAEQNVYADVYKVLLAGMLVSTAIYVIAIVSALLHPEYIPLRSEWIKQHYHWSVLIRGIISLDPTALMLVATALLILTPVTRVAVSIYAFAVDRDAKFVAVSVIVLLVMIITVLLGLFGLK